MRRLLQSATINTWISIGVRMGGLALLLPLVLRYLDLQQILIWQLQSSIMAMMLWIDFSLTRLCCTNQLKAGCPLSPDRLILRLQ